MATLSSQTRAFLAQGPLAHVVTLNRDGSQQVSCTWVSVDGDTLVIASLPENQKIKNLRRDPRIVLSFETRSQDAMGLIEYLVVHGRATIHEGGAAALLQEQARVYIGPDVKFPPFDNPPPGFLVRVDVERIGGNGPWESERGES
jgi:PPOX class probable F420-dependent enzyme